MTSKKRNESQPRASASGTTGPQPEREKEPAKEPEGAGAPGDLSVGDEPMRDAAYVMNFGTIPWGRDQELELAAEEAENPGGMLRRIVDEARAVRERNAVDGKPGPVCQLVLMGTAAWYSWSQPERAARLQSRGAIMNKARIDSNLEIRYTPNLGDWVLVV